MPLPFSCVFVVSRRRRRNSRRIIAAIIGTDLKKHFPSTTNSLLFSFTSPTKKKQISNQNRENTIGSKAGTKLLLGEKRVGQN